MISEKDLLHFKKKIYNTSSKIIIISHRNPDGDSVGSCLALYIFLKKLYHDVYIIFPTILPKFLCWLPYSNKILIYSKKKNKEIKKIIYESEIIFFIDFNSIFRIKPLDVFLKCSNAFKILIDHHIFPENFDLMFYDSLASATAIIIFRLIKKINCIKYIDHDIAICLYTAIVSDTNYFRFSYITSETHIITAYLIDKGINVNKVQNSLYYRYNIYRMKLLSIIIKRIKILYKYQASYTYITSQDMIDFHCKKGDTDGFVNYGLHLKSVILTALFIEDKSKKNIKISFRSKKSFDVNDFSKKYFFGGGHKNASGGISKKNLNDTFKFFIKKLSLYKKKFLKKKNK